MAAGEYISVKSQRELLEGELVLGSDELAAIAQGAGAQPDLLVRLQALDPEKASAFAAGGDAEAATEVMATSGIGITGLGSPRGAATSSFVSFAVGAAVPVVPFFVGSGTAALSTSAVLAGFALFLTGAAISLVTNRPVVRSGLRQLIVGALAAAGTYVVGFAVGAFVA
jgi:VIT1/CCC1 family predicted Fe2+/Mn2+ transporter